jgi:hypothetical protein
MNDKGGLKQPGVLASVFALLIRLPKKDEYIRR